MSRGQDDENPFIGGNDTRKPLRNNDNIKLDNWLDEEEGGSSYAPAPSSESATVDPNIPRLIMFTRLTNLGLSICMIIVSLLSLLTTTSPTTGVLACYVSVFACLLCCFETHLKQVSKVIASNFGFLYSAKSRAVFLVFVGTLLFSFNLFGMVLGICMIVNAGFNIYIMFKYPGFDEAQRQDAQAEITEYLKQNQAFTKQVVDAGMKVTTDFVANNPDLARQGAEAYVKSASSSSSSSNSASL